jgi:peptidoglycan/LPS O-acetylase OafA/YrhL
VIQQEAAPSRQRSAGEQKERGFRPDIQGMRAIAVGMVVIYHLYPSLLPGGFAGVDVFFVISGFLITGHLWRGYAKTGAVSLADFWGRRAKRLLPAAALVLTVTWIVSRIALPSTRLADTASQVRASALYFQNWQLARNAVDYLKADDAASPVQHFWSLSVEEQFYLGWPLLFLLAGAVALTARRRARLARARKVAIGLAGAVVVGSLLYSVYDTRADPAAAYFVTTTRLWELGLGGLLALAPERLAGRLGRHGWLGWAGLAMVVASAFVLNGSMAFPGALALLPAGGAVALIAGGSAAARLGPARLTSARPMVFIGGVSYSLYLWHWPIIALWTARRGHSPGALAGPAIVAASVLLAWLTKVFVEDRVRTASLLSGHSWRSLATTLTVAVPVILVSVFIVGEPAPFQGNLGPGYPGAAALTDSVSGVKKAPVLPQPDAIKLPAYWQQGCLLAETASVPKKCVYGDTANPVLTVALVGDSFAGDWFTPLQQIANQRHWKLVTELHSVCPWTSTMMVTPDTGGPYTPCHTWGMSVLHDLLTSIKPDVVITSDYPGLATIGYPAGGPPSQADIGAGMAQYWTQLEHHGISVVAIRESPLLGIDEPACVARNPDSTAKCDQSITKAIPAHPPTLYAAAAMAGPVPVPVINMNSLICGPRECSPVVGNVLVFQDNHHLTSTYSLTTAPFLEQRLLAADKVLTRT